MLRPVHSEPVNSGVELSCSYSIYKNKRPCKLVRLGPVQDQIEASEWKPIALGHKRCNKANVIKENGSLNRGGMKATAQKSGCAGPC